jgi:electron transport complex protein RnfD
VYVFRSAQPGEGHWFNGLPFYPAFLIALSISAAVGTEAALQRWMGRKVTIGDGSAVITGLLLAMVIPPRAPWFVPIAGSAFAIGIAKHCFGGLGCNIWNPALAGRAFILASWLPFLATWYYPADTLRPVTRTAQYADAVSCPTPLGARKDALKELNEGRLQVKLEAPADDKKAILSELNDRNSTHYLDLIVGTTGGCIGETSKVLLLLGGLYLIARGYVKWPLPVSFIGAVALSGWALPVKVQGELLWCTGDPAFHVLAGGVFLGAFFMATDMVTSPLTQRGMAIFGAGCGLLTVIIRLYGGYPEGVCYAILIMNTAVPLIDRYIKPRKLGAQG